MRKNVGRVMLVLSLLAGNLVLGRSLFAQGGGCDTTCPPHQPSCHVIPTGSGGTAQGCLSIRGYFTCGGSGCEGADE